MLGIPPVAGRAFREEEKPSAAPVAMIGEGLWKGRFGGDRNLIGRVIILNDLPTTVIGIAPAALNLLSGADVYTPLTIDPAREIRLNHQIFTLGRLKNGVSIQQAQAEMNVVSAQMGQQYPEIRDWGIRLITMFDSFGIYGVLAYSVNQRTGEIGVRMALGATRRAVLRLIVGEGMKVVVIGIVTGLAGGLALGRSVSSLIFGVPVHDPAIFMGVAIALAGVALAACVIPALRASRVDPIRALRSE